MADRLALGVIPGTGWSARDIQMVAREAEDAGFDAIFTTEVNNDALATAQLTGAATQHIQVGTWVANIYLRHAYVCAQGAALIADVTEGRFILGLGVSHAPVDQALEIDMLARAGRAVRRYVRPRCRPGCTVKAPPTHLPQRPAVQPVPLYVATLTSPIVAAAAALADGIMPLLWSAERVKQSKAWVARGRAKAPTLGPLTITLGLPTFLGDDLETLPTPPARISDYSPPFPSSNGSSGRVALRRRQPDGAGAGASALTDRLLDAVCLLGPEDRCSEQLAAFRAAGVDMPILLPPAGVEGTRAVIQAFRR